MSSARFPSRLPTHRPRSAWAALWLAIAGLGCVSLDEQQVEGPATLMMGDLGSMTHVSVFEDVWLGGHATADDLDIARRRGIEVVIDLGDAPTGDIPTEVEVICDELGLRYVRAPLDADDPDLNAVERVLNELADSGREALLLLCNDGARCATVFAVHRVLEGELDVTDALEEARRAGLKPDSGEIAVRQLLEHFLN